MQTDQSDLETELEQEQEVEEQDRKNKNGKREIEEDDNMDGEEDEEMQSEEDAIIHKIPVKGDIILVDMEGKELEVWDVDWDEIEEDAANVGDRDFSMGRVLSIEGARIKVHWMNSYSKGLKGEWKSIYRDAKTKLFYAFKSNSQAWTSDLTCHVVTLYDMIGEPFLLEKNRLPKTVLKLLENRENENKSQLKKGKEKNKN